ncbi:MAG: DUF5666 domain-containing protein [Nitrospirota bacterium]
MKRSSILFNLLGAVGLVGLLFGCGSGGGGGASTGTASGSSAASGTITGFGSVIVNGKKFETNGASVMVDGQPVPSCTVNSVEQCGLKEGMTVKVSGSFSGSSHSASIITQEDTVEGPITNVDVPNSRFEVLGQIVLVDENTKFDSGVSLNNLADGQVVEVSGFVKSDGIIAASFIERKALTVGCSLVCEVKGTIKSHVHGTTSFQIGNLTVNYGAAGVDIGDMPPPSGSNWNGLFVEVKGTSLSGTTLTATKVEPENQGVGNNVDELEVEGFVTKAGSASGNIIDFTIGDTQVRTTASTLFRGGTVDEIVVGAKMSAEGRFDGSTLIAKHVKFHESVKLEGNAAVNGNLLTLAGLPGVIITVNSQTELKDGGNPITLNDLGGNHVRVRGRVSGNSTVIATRIELRPGNTDDVDLQGPVQEPPSDPFLKILGVAVNTTGVEFEGLDDGPINRTAFFNAVKEGTLVKVKGRLDGVGVTWREAELED